MTHRRVGPRETWHVIISPSFNVLHWCIFETRASGRFYRGRSSGITFLDEMLLLSPRCTTVQWRSCRMLKQIPFSRCKAVVWHTNCWLSKQTHGDQHLLRSGWRGNFQLIMARENCTLFELWLGKGQFESCLWKWISSDDWAQCDHMMSFKISLD